MKRCFSLLEAYDKAALLADALSGEVVFVNQAWKTAFGAPQVLHTEHIFKKMETRDKRLVWLHKGKHVVLKESSHELEDQRFTLYLAQELEAGVSSEAFLQAKEMSALLVHRFRSPLTAAVGYLGLISAELDEANLVEIRDASRQSLQEITDMLHQMNTLVQEEPVFMGMLELNSFVTLWMEQHAAVKQVALFRSGTMVDVKADAIRLRFILDALFRNAVEARETEEEPIEVHVSRTGIEVKNFTLPIPRQQEQKLFMPFFTTKARHLGLGLSLSSRYAQQMGARLELVSNTHIDGVCFRLMF